MTIEDRSQHRVVSVTAASGEIDIDTVGGLDKALAEATGVGRFDVVVDLSAVTFMDASGLGVLVKHYKLVKLAAGRVRLVVCHRRVHLVLEITQLTSIFPIYDTLEAALIDTTS